MDIYKVVSIEEADYGCEECSCGARALVRLVCGSREIKTEMTEEHIARVGIAEGKSVIPRGETFVPYIKVAAAVICAECDGKKQVLATQRGYGEYKHKWEFPGGKTEAGETSQAALVREIREELCTEIKIGEHLCTVEYDYPLFHLSMDCFLAELSGAAPVLAEHEAAKWLTAENIASVDWLPADMEVIEKLKNLIL